MNSKTIISLDIARGVAAMLVFISHVRAYLMIDYGKLPQASKGVVTKGFYFITSLGHESVMIFFVLSGYLVAGSVYRSFQTNKFSWDVYLTNRLTRLYIVFIPALLLTLFWDKIGILLTHSTYYEGALGNILPVGPKEPVHHSFSVFIQSVLFLQTIASPIFGTNGVVWSLANEFWYYIVFPIGMILIAGLKDRNIIKVVLATLLIVCFFIFFPLKIVLGFGVWMLGFIAYLVSNDKLIFEYLNKKWVKYTSLLIFVICIIFSAFDTSTSWGKDYVVGIGYTLVLISFLRLQLNDSIIKRTFQFFSDISYTLYIVHVPLLAFSITYIFNNIRLNFSGESLLIFICYIGGLIIYAYIIYLLFEKRTPLLRNWILNKIK